MAFDDDGHAYEAIGILSNHAADAADAEAETAPGMRPTPTA